MKIKSGFTLIETMIMVVVLGLVVSLAVGIVWTNFKGNSDKAIAIKIFDDIKSLNDAQLSYYSKHSKWGTKEEMLASGVIKSWPVANPQVADADCLAAKGQAFEYQYWYGEEGEEDPNWVVTAVLPCVQEEFADFFNSVNAM